MKNGWGAHIAPALPCVIKPGQVQTVIFDVGVFDGPVTIAQWTNFLSLSEKYYDVTGYFDEPELVHQNPAINLSFFAPKS